MGSALDLFRLDGKTALITGASRNIGRAIAYAYADAGADLVLVARKQAGLESVADEIRARTGRSVVARVCDVASAAQVEALTTDLRSTTPRIDILVNNAHSTGGTFGVPLLENDDAPWQRTLDVNLFGPLRLARALVPPMIAAGGGVVLNVISGVAFSPMPTMAPYGVSKAALLMFTRCLAREYAPTVRVNALCPGTMRADEDQRGLTPAQLNATPLRRVARGAEAAGAALYLASEASSFSTGDIVFVNGGLTSLSGYPDEMETAAP